MKETSGGHGVRLQASIVILFPLWLFFISTSVGVLQRNAQESYPSVSLLEPVARIGAVIGAAWVVVAEQ